MGADFWYTINRGNHMDEAAKAIAEHWGAWAYVIVPAIASMTAAFVGGCWYVAKSLVRGATYYTARGWELLELAANKHFFFVDQMSEAMNVQTGCLEQIKAATEASYDALSKMGSDPMGKMREAVVQDVIAAMKAHGMQCEYREAEKVVEAHLKKR